MLEADAATNSVVIVICTDQGTSRVDLDGGKRPLNHNEKYAKHSKCPYAASTIVALNALPQSEAFRIESTIRLSFEPNTRSLLVSKPELPSPARGPPIA